MSMRSLGKMYRLAEAGETIPLLAHIVELEEAYGADPDFLNLALLGAAEANQLETVLALLERGANIEGASQRSYIHPLWKAAKRGHLEMVQLLVRRGADPKATDNNGNTALDYARKYSRHEVVRYLESLS